MSRRSRVLTVLLVAAGCADAPQSIDAVASGDAILGAWAGAVDVPAIQCESPASFSTVNLAAGQTSIPVQLTWSTNATEEIESGAMAAAAWVDGTSAATSTSVTPFTVDLKYGEHHVTLALTEDGVALENAEARCSVVIRVTRPCFDDDDCADDYFCNTNTCEAGAGGVKRCAFGPPPVADCCQTDFQCAAGAVCDPGSHTCGECNDDAQCDDGNACTTDTCTGGTCLSVVEDPGCCDCSAEGLPIADQCTGGGFCGVASCDCESNLCEYDPKTVPGGTCCETGDHASCDDGDPCTEDSCVANACRHVEVNDGSTECCTGDAECNDGNPCTAESCDLTLNACVTEAASGDGCCLLDSDCDDGDVLTLDACVVHRCVHTPDAGYCEIPNLSDVVINEIMVNPAAVSDALGEWVELHNRTGQAIDLSGWALAELGQPTSAVFSPGAPFVIEPFGFVVLCKSDDTGLNGGVSCDGTLGDDFQVANSEDSVLLMDASGAVHDAVEYDGGINFPDTGQAGRSMALLSPQHDNEIGSSWTLSVAPMSGSTDKGTPGSSNVDVHQVLELAQCHEGPVDDPCTLDTCVDDTCTHVPVEGCCNVAADCTPPNACHSAACVDHVCQFSPIPAPECCLTNGECDDGSPCSVDKCIANACRHGTAAPGLGAVCCESDADCPGAQNPCLIAECNLDTNTCKPAMVAADAGCCSTNSYPQAASPLECDDGDPSTIDACKDFQCISWADPNWCDGPAGTGAVNNCHLDGNPCTDTACDVAAKTCLLNPVPGCCASNADCFDGNPCTEDQCNPGTGSCEFPGIFGCCFKSQEAAHCDDGNVCTADTCVNLSPLEGSPGEQYGRCRGIRSDPGCCAFDSDCNDGNACTTDVCDQQTNTCSHAPVVPADGTVCCDAKVARISEQCDDGNGCTVERCVENRCEHEPVEPVGGTGCCDPDAAALGSVAQQCDDGNACTDDLCLFGWCYHTVTSGASCCAADVDCDDGNPCTTDACVNKSGTMLCEHKPFNCNDGKFCNGQETCNPSVGCVPISGSVPVVDDGVACTVDVCDEGADEVVHTPNDFFCDNNLFCDGQEYCDLVLGCQDGAPPSGDDGINCTQDLCDETTDTFTHTPSAAVCDDGKLCNGEETCDAASGCKKGTGAVDIDDGIACTTDSCDDATQTAKHLPDNSFCNDGLLCTADVCSTTAGCQNTLLGGFCLIAGVCYPAGSTKPGDGCLVCDPAQATGGWSVKTATAEQCNDIDDDCDGATDEAETGSPLTQACQNPCGDVGVESCQDGAWTGCTAPELEEVCDNGVDDDCDGATDAPGCGDGKPPVIGAELTFTSTRGEVENLVADNLDGTYESAIRDLVNPNQSGVAGVTAYGASAPGVSYDVVAAPPVEIEVVSMRDTLYADAAEARLAVQLRDQQGRPVATGTEVVVTVTGPGVQAGISDKATCLTAANGQCTAVWVAPPPVFDTGGVLQVSVEAAGLPAAPIQWTAVPRPSGLDLQPVSGGLELPRSPRFPQETFEVPVIVNIGAAQLSAYDIHVSFNKFMLNVTAINPGTCADFNQIVSNVGTGANSSGTLTFNALTNAPGACATGEIHLATITFKVLTGLTPDDPTVSAFVTGTLVDLTDPNFVSLASDEPMQVADLDGVSEEGKVRAWSAAVMGIHARSPDAQLLNRKAITGATDTVQLQVIAYKRDFTTASVATDVATGYGNTDAAVVSVTQSGFVTAGETPGSTTIAVTHKGAVSTARVRTRVATTPVLELTDPVLQPIAGAITPSGNQLYQTTGYRVRTSWLSDGGVAWEQDVTGLFGSIAQVSLPPQLAYTPSTGRISGVQAGEYTVGVKSSQGNEVATAPLEVASDQPATCTSLSVLAPCQLELTDVDPDHPGVQLGTAEVEASVYSYLNTYQQKCQVQVYANFDDGSRARITGQAGVAVSSQHPGIATATAGGLLTAQSPGTAKVNADWTIGGNLLCSGATQVLVDLPEATSITVEPSAIVLAISEEDPAHTLKGLPTSQQLTVTVHFEDGSSQEFTNHPTTIYDAASADPLDLVAASGGLVTTTGNAEGYASVKVSVGLYGGLSASAQFIVVKASGLSAEIYETYSPTLPRVTEHTLSWIEGTTTRQDGLFEAVVEFSDGSSVDVTDDPALTITPVQPNTTVPQPEIVAFDKAAGRVTGQGMGQVDVLFELGDMSFALKGVAVDGQKEGVVVLVPELGVDTLTGVKDVGTATIKVWGVMNDGTRRRFSDSRFIPGLLSFTSSSPAAATVNAHGVTTIRGNGSTVLSVDLSSSVDVTPQYDPPAQLAVDCNLAPGCGDIDLGDLTGLAFKDRAPGATFTLEGRINTCDAALGAFDVLLTYDPEVLQVDQVVAHGATTDVLFNANWFNPGEILINAIFNPLGAAKKGANLPIFLVHYTALKGGDGISEMGGHVEGAVGLAGQDIGPPGPRPLVASVGLLDPACSMPDPFGDLDGDCDVDAADVLRAQRRVMAGELSLSDVLRIAAVAR